MKHTCIFVAHINNKKMSAHSCKKSVSEKYRLKKMVSWMLAHIHFDNILIVKFGSHQNSCFDWLKLWRILFERKKRRIPSWICIHHILSASLNIYKNFKTWSWSYKNNMDIVGRNNSKILSHQSCGNFQSKNLTVIAHPATGLSFCHLLNCPLK